MGKLKTVRNISVVLFAVFLIATVALFVAVRNLSDEDIQYTEVSAVITEKTSKTFKGKVTPVIYARYDDKEYLLKNVRKEYMYSEGSIITAYLYDGELYEGTEGIAGETPLGTLYFISLGLTALSGFTLLMSGAMLAEKKKRGERNG